MGKRKKIEKQLAVYKKMQKGFLHILLIVLVCFGMVQMGELQEVQAARSDLMTLEGEKDVVVILTYDKEAPEVSITDPSGKVYAKESDFAAVQKGQGGSLLLSAKCTGRHLVHRLR